MDYPNKNCHSTQRDWELRKKVNGSGLRPSTEVFNHHPKCFYYIKPRVWNQEKSKPWDRLKPIEFTDLYRSSTGSGEQSLWAHAGMPPAVTLPWQFPQLWFENHLGAVLQLPAYLPQLLLSAMKPFGCLQRAWKGPASSILRKCEEQI